MDNLLKYRKFLNFSIEYNPHKVNYQTIDDYIDNNQCCDELFHENFYSKEDYIKSKENDELWVSFIYHLTPVGSYHLYSSNLELLLKMMDDIYSIEIENKK